MIRSTPGANSCVAVLATALPLRDSGILSSLSNTELALVRERARAALHPAQADMQSKLAKALEELRQGVAATERLLRERCELREDDDGQARPNREPVPNGARAAVA